MQFRRKTYEILVYFKSHQSSLVRASVGLSLVIAGILGPFLPLLGAWMFPMGLILLSVDFPVARRLSAYFLTYWISFKGLWRKNRG